jgi:hypothetical protein
MVHWLKGLLYGSTPAEFRSAYGVAESVERLLAATKRSAFSSMGDTAAVGKVSAEAVRLQRVIPMVHNSFKPFFTGRFETRDGVTVLTGHFGMATFTKVFMSVWLGLVALIAGGFLLAIVNSTASSPPELVMGPLLMLAAGVGIVALGKWFARNDAAWLSRVIAQALGAPVAGTAAPVREVDAAAVPGVLKVVALVLAASGVMVVFMDFFELPSVAPQFRQWHGVYAVLDLALAAGVWRRHPWAWLGGFVLLGLSIITTLLAFPVNAQSPTPPFIRVVFGIFALVVVGVWARWWYAQRKHFLWT